MKKIFAFKRLRGLSGSPDNLKREYRISQSYIKFANLGYNIGFLIEIFLILTQQKGPVFVLYKKWSLKNTSVIL